VLLFYVCTKVSRGDTMETRTLCPYFCPLPCHLGVYFNFTCIYCNFIFLFFIKRFSFFMYVVFKHFLFNQMYSYFMVKETYLLTYLQTSYSIHIYGLGPMARRHRGMSVTPYSCNRKIFKSDFLHLR